MHRSASFLTVIAGLAFAAAGVAAAPVNKCVVDGKVTYQQGPCPSAGVRKTPTLQELNAETRKRRESAPASAAAAAPALAPAPARVAPSTPGVAGAFSCDTRKYCSQMQSCAEAKYFLANCPGVKMDGDGNGIPCEKQWCVR
jgi:hypothetical protein